MQDYGYAPLLTERDRAESAEDGIDPLGTEPLADALAVRLVPGVRERMRHPRFLTAMAVSLEVCRDFDEEALAADRVSEPWQVFEWYLVEGLVRTAESEDRLGLPGSQKASKAIADGVPLSATTGGSVSWRHRTKVRRADAMGCFNPIPDPRNPRSLSPAKRQVLFDAICVGGTDEHALS